MKEIMTDIWTMIVGGVVGNCAGLSGLGSEESK